MRQSFLAVLCVSVAAAAACNNEVNWNPTVPSFSDFTPVSSMRNLEITGKLKADRGTVSEATVLYDGKELAGARVTCPVSPGCLELDLAATTRSTTGHHTISFQVLSQSLEAIDYRAEGTVRVSRDGLGFELALPLRPSRATLRSGETIDFGVEFVN